MFPTLRHKRFDLPKDLAGDVFSISLTCKHLVLGLVVPELAKELNDIVNRINLMPYEHSVSSFLANDYLYDRSCINEPADREFSDMQRIIGNVDSDGDFIPVIVCYLEFPNSI